MSLEDFAPDIENSQESWWNATEKTKEVSEVFKEAVKKATARTQRVQKDEKKAKKSDFLLANFLVQIIVNKKYDILLRDLLAVRDLWYPPHFLLGILSLISIEVSHAIRDISHKKYIQFDFFEAQTTEFDDNHLNNAIKKRINEWVEDIIDIVSLEYSSVLTQRLKEIIGNDEYIIVFTAKVFTFFLQECNITINPNKAKNIADFILQEVQKSLSRLILEEI